MTDHTITILAISGSLRAQSSSVYIIQAFENMLPSNIKFIRYNGLATLPHFDDRPEVPETVLQFRQQITAADAVLICTPEYAFGIPGSLKNALDWTVGSGEFVNKPVALITASSQGEKAHTALLQVLTALSAVIPDNGNLLISFVRAKLDEKGNVKDAVTLQKIHQAMEALLKSTPEH